MRIFCWHDCINYWEYGLYSTVIRWLFVVYTWLRIWSSLADSDKIGTISFQEGDAFSNFDIFKGIESYELPLYTHSPRMLNFYILEEQNILRTHLGTLLAKKYTQFRMKTRYYDEMLPDWLYK